MIIARLLLAFVGTASSGVLFSVPRRALWACGAVGLFAWWGEAALEKVGLSTIAATFAAAVAVAVAAELLARVLHLPATCISIPGIVPLVPGLTAYDAMYHFVDNDWMAGNTLAVQAILMAASIAAGLAIAASLFRLRRR
ncbi:MAG: threonine/serine exporter family protein [Candidatus Xenobia bacterium]